MSYKTHLVYLLCFGGTGVVAGFAFARMVKLLARQGISIYPALYVIAAATIAFAIAHYLDIRESKS